MEKVFLSYLHEDKDKVERLASDLNSRGIHTWLNRDDLEPGVQWGIAIRKAIRSGSYFIACFSENYISRKKNYMNAEIRIAIEELQLMPQDTQWFIPIRFDNCKLPYFEIGLGKTLNDIQITDLIDDNWDENLLKIITVINPKPNEYLERRLFSATKAVRHLVELYFEDDDYKKPEVEKGDFDLFYSTFQLNIDGKYFEAGMIILYFVEKYAKVQPIIGHFQYRQLITILNDYPFGRSFFYQAANKYPSLARKLFTDK